MTFTLGNTSRVLANAKAVTCTINGWTATMTRALSEVTTMCESGAKFIPGLSMGQLSLKGPQDSTGQSLHGEIAAAVGVDNGIIITICPYGTAAGQSAMTAVGDLSEWTIDAAVADAVATSATLVADEMVDAGFVVHALGAETATGNTASIDRGAATANGGVAVLHATAYSGLTNAAIKVQHSVDNSVWTDLATFTIITAVGAQRLFLAAGTTVNRYVRASLTVSGAGSVTYLVALEPR